MDVTMPRMDGIAATRQIKAQLPAVRVIALSMHEEKDLAAAMREAGAIDYLPKGAFRRNPDRRHPSSVRQQLGRVAAVTDSVCLS